MSYAPTISYTICSIISNTMSYTMSYVFAHHHLRPLEWLARVFHDKPCISHCIFIYSHKSWMISSVHCAAAHNVRACAAPPPTHTVTINIYHFNGSVAQRPPLVARKRGKCWNPLLQPPAWPKQNDLLHPDPYSEAIIYPSLRGPAHFMGPLAFSTANCHGHFFRIWTAEIPYFLPLLARC